MVRCESLITLQTTLAYPQLPTSGLDTFAADNAHASHHRVGRFGAISLFSANRNTLRSILGFDWRSPNLHWSVFYWEFDRQFPVLFSLRLLQHCQLRQNALVRQLHLDSNMMFFLKRYSKSLFTLL